MVLGLCAPSIHLLCARNWKAAISGWALMASRVANRVAVSTPLRTVSVIVLVMLFPPCCALLASCQSLRWVWLPRLDRSSMMVAGSVPGGCLFGPGGRLRIGVLGRQDPCAELEQSLQIRGVAPGV